MNKEGPVKRDRAFFKKGDVISAEKRKIDKNVNIYKFMCA